MNQWDGQISFLLAVSLSLFVTTATAGAEANNGLNKNALQWAPVEWNLTNTSYDGNPFDLEAAVTFVHEGSGEKRVTGMFYDGGTTWKFRFTGTRPGTWSFVTESADKDLDGRRGTVTVKPNPDGYGFVTHKGNRWARQRGVDGRLEAFVPQYIVYDALSAYHNKPEKIDADIQTFFVDHGFNGFHTYALCHWFDFEHERSNEIESRDPNPDPRTFEALELLIRKVHAAGGVVHIWAWGDESRRQTPVRWGINGQVDQRLQRYIAARLGPLPGWTMGYGFDLWEWVKGDQLTVWHDNMHRHFGWPHMLGGRASQNRLNQLSEKLDYSSYEQHRPSYDTYVKTIQMRPTKPSFSEDRFRIRKPSPYPKKDYDEVMTRRGLWHSMMAGGVANIWGNLVGAKGGGSRPYPHPEWIKTNAELFRGRFTLDLVRDNAITDGAGLRSRDRMQYIFYKEDSDMIRMDLSQMPSAQPAVAVDAKKPYAEINLGRLDSKMHTWKPPHKSDWAVAVGRFSGR